MATKTAGLDVRLFSGFTDMSELLNAYKSAASARAQADRYRLVEGVDKLVPYGPIMAGDWQKIVPWRKRRR